MGRNHLPKLGQQAFTLIELLLYTAIIGVLLLAAVGFFGLAVDARVKNQTISEVNQQGQAVMDNILQTIRNATDVSSPAIGTSGNALSVTVPTGSLSPTVFSTNSTNMGLSSDAGTTDTSDSGYANAIKFTASASGTVSTLYALLGATIAASPNNKAQMAIYGGTASAPTTLLASSADTTLTANTWNAFSISPVSVTSGQIYWLAYNSNGVGSADNNMRVHTGTSGQNVYLVRTYGTWPSPWSGGTAQDLEMSVYAPIVTSNSTALQIKEGAGSPIPLTSDDVQVSGLTFTNLSRSGTAGNIQVSFTVSRVNTAGRNEYDYQRTFTGTASLRL